MPRVPGIWFREAAGCYYTKVNGKQHWLSPVESESKRMLYWLVGREEKTQARCRMSVKKLFDTYLAKTRGEKSDGRHHVQRLHLQAFCDRLGRRRLDPPTAAVEDLAVDRGGADVLVEPAAPAPSGGRTRPPGGRRPRATWCAGWRARPSSVKSGSSVADRRYGLIVCHSRK